MTRAASDIELAIFTRLSEADADWQQLKDAGLGNPYQSLDWLRAWTETLGRQLKVEPILVAGRRQDQTQLILPLGLEHTAGIKTLTFLGHQHGNQNTGIWDRAFYDSVDASGMHSLLRKVCAKVGADLLKLENVPMTWHGRTHPLVFDGAAPSPSPIFTRRLGDDFDALFRDTHSKSSRKNLLRKERHLQAAGDFRIEKAAERQEIERCLAIFLEQRELRARESGVPNAFATPAARSFLARQLGLDDAMPASLDLWYLETGGAIRATYLCAEQDDTIYAYSNSIAHDDMLPNSPGLVLIKEIIARACADDQLQVLDLGLGEERYKTSWAEPVPLADSLLAVTAKGALKQKIVATALKAKTMIRNSDILWPAVKRLRKWKAGFSKTDDQKSN
ncbi:GNAT family N-acetyltransferase [Labrenzia sp. VG12]|uniref:GNAT family N-acetyltransferase n=1 Tax=Labrenzia sp. VG12 TaxID=2021862 RepID=UPI000B8C35EF|nr:GNAT family N-acetyltransferase [Labrenzia sp. VG12]ASP32250.1 hypothetical protein CHH27_02500 [Labrenzia sp. VG12]